MRAIYPMLGKYEKAIEEPRRDRARSGLSRPRMPTLATHYHYLDRLGEAENAFSEPPERKIEHP